MVEYPATTEALRAGAVKGVCFIELKYTCVLDNHHGLS